MRKALYLTTILVAAFILLWVKPKEKLESGTDIKSANIQIPSNIVTVQVRRGIDTAEEFFPDGRVSLNSSDLELIQEEGDQMVGIRFDSVTIPKGAIIVSAYLRFTVDEASSEPTFLTFSGELNTNSSEFKRINYDISGRHLTLSTVDWEPKPWLKVGESGLTQQTPDLSSIIQEVISLEGWDSGNAISFVINGTGKRVACSTRPHRGTRAPILTVKWK